MASRKIDGQLKDWSELKNDIKCTGILIGNGASRAIWEEFGYPSLFEIARSPDIANPLTPKDVALFDSFGTRNFERVLASLATTMQVQTVLDRKSTEIAERYCRIQNALVQAVRSTHIPWMSVQSSTLETIRNEFLEYEYVYSTNYDLIAYWAVMHFEGDGFKDFFWSESFDLGNTEVWDNATKILYLHGGLHLYHTPSGGTLKRTATGSENLLDLFGTSFNGATPLFVVEGTSEDKLTSIFQSDYLTFTYFRVAHHEGPLVIFGHSLGNSDEHIVAAIRKSGVQDILVALLPDTPDEIIRQKAHFIQKLPQTRIRWFDATTHPLGGPDLFVEP